MPRTLAGLLPLVLLAACHAGGSPPPADGATALAPADSVADWSAAFADEGAVGTFVLYDAATGRTTRHDPDRAARRFLPASTFKVYNSLVALDEGVVRDPDSTFAWDGTPREIAAWNRDHTLRTGIENSVVWLYQRIARDVGRERYAAWLAREPFGNGQMGGDVGLFWLDGSLKVSADEQAAFMDRLRRGDLAFSDSAQATVRAILPTLASAALAEGGRQRLRGKTGLGRRDDGSQIGWIVGWVEGPEGDVVFAMNAEEAPGASFDAVPGRLRIVRAVLGDAGVFPDGSAERP